MDEETRKATLMALITSKSMPSALQWGVIQVRWQECSSNVIAIGAKPSALALLVPVARFKDCQGCAQVEPLPCGVRLNEDAVT